MILVDVALDVLKIFHQQPAIKTCDRQILRPAAEFGNDFLCCRLRNTGESEPALDRLTIRCQRSSPLSRDLEGLFDPFLEQSATGSALRPEADLDRAIGQ